MTIAYQVIADRDISMKPMHATPDAEAVCRAFRLGKPTFPMTPVDGGFSHRVWRLQTESGEFAVKQLNPTVVARPGALDRFRRSEQIAAAFSEAGVRAVVARDATTDPLREIDGTWLLAYPWADGLPVALSRVTVDQARTVGATLGHLHRRNLAHSGVPRPSARAVSAEHWRDLAERNAAQPWSTALIEVLPLLLSLSADCVAAADALREEPTLVSHRDLVAENVLWDAAGAALIDWEAAAWINPMVELVSAAIDWSGYIEARSDKAIFEAVVHGYREVAPFDAAMAREALPLSTGSWLRWLAYNLGRASSTGDVDDAEQALGVRQTVASLSAIAQVPAHQPLWRQWLADA